jgi:hypothetical protein
MESRPVSRHTTGPGSSTAAIIKRRSLTGCDTAANRPAAAIGHRRTVSLFANGGGRAPRSIREPGPVPRGPAASDRSSRSIREGCSRWRLRTHTTLPPGGRNCSLDRQSRQLQSNRAQDTKTHHFPHHFTPSSSVGNSTCSRIAFHVPDPEKPIDSENPDLKESDFPWSCHQIIDDCHPNEHIRQAWLASARCARGKPQFWFAGVIR